MWWCAVLVVAGSLLAGMQAYAPSHVIRFPVSGYVLAPGANSPVLPQKVIIKNVPGKVVSSTSPQFTLKPDGTITLDSTDLCVEAEGGIGGDSVRVGHCTGTASQKWNRIQNSHGLDTIQLEDSSQCLDVLETAGGWNGAQLELRGCDEVSQSWSFDLPLTNTFPKQVSSMRPAHFLLSLLASSVLLALVLSTRFMRWSRKSHEVIATHAGVPCGVDQGGVSLIECSHVHQVDEPVAKELAGGALQAELMAAFDQSPMLGKDPLDLIARTIRHAQAVMSPGKDPQEWESNIASESSEVCFGQFKANPYPLAACTRATRAPQPIASLADDALAAAGTVQDSPILPIAAALVFVAIVYQVGGVVTLTVPFLLILLGGDPAEQDPNNPALKTLIEKFTPSAWKKAWMTSSDLEAEGGTLEPANLPEWQGEESKKLSEKEALYVMERLKLETIDVPGIGPVNTSFISLKPEPSKAIDAPPVFLIHGFDSSVLEFRYLVQELVSAGLRVEAMEWWTGGFTDRKPILDKVRMGSKPWDLIRDHLFAFYQRQLSGEKAVVLGASLGGAVAMDFAVTHTDCVEGLLLMDSGGESYKQPAPILTAIAANPVTNLFAWRAANGLLPYPHVWFTEDSWRDSLQAYLQSGGYERRVNPPFIRKVPVPTKVLWGEDDDVLPVSDAYKYEKDLPNCIGVQLIPNAQHAPALENPPFVVQQLIDFTMQMAEQRSLSSAAA